MHAYYTHAVDIKCMHITLMLLLWLLLFPLASTQLATLCWTVVTHVALSHQPTIPRYKFVSIIEQMRVSFLGNLCAT